MTLRNITGGVVIAWLTTFISIGVGLFMSPFLIHHLGETGYGLWVLVQSVVSYMYFMDLGLRTTVVRFTAAAHAVDDQAEVSRVVSAALWIRLVTAVLIMAFSLIMTIVLPHVFHVPTAYVTTARAALMLCALTLSSALVFSVFAAVLSGMGRFDLLGMVELGQVSLTALGLVPLIRSGHGLIAMASWQLAVTCMASLANCVMCFRLSRGLSLVPGFPEKRLLRSMWSLSFYVLLANGAGQMILYTDNLVVGACVAAAAVSYYAVAGKMVEYLRQAAIAILRYYMPLVTSYVARREMNGARQLHTRGTQAVLLITYPVVVTLIVRGHSLLRLWMGENFASHAFPVLRILTISAAIMLANSSVNGFAPALDDQRTLAWATIIEGIGNLTLSIVLAKKIGVVGVAIGTLIPTFIFSVFFWPARICHLLKMSTLRFMVQAWLKPVLAMLPFAGASYWASRHFSSPHLINFAIETLFLLPSLVVGLLVVFWKDVPLVLRLIRQRSADGRIVEAT